MNILRTMIWVIAAIGFLIFAVYNWKPVELTLWQNLVLETKVPVLAILAFTAGFVPMWALHRSVVWGLNRRVRALETSLKNTAMARQAELFAASAADTSVDKPGKSESDGGDPFNPAVTSSDGGSGK